MYPSTARNPIPPSDAELVERLRNGEMAALEIVYDRYSSALATFAYSMLRSRERADDALHDAFVVATGRIGQLRDPSRLRPWLYAIVRSECLRGLRGSKRESALEEWHDPGTDDAAGDDLHRAEIASLVREAMGGLSPKDKEIVELSLRHDLDNSEIAAVLGVKASHVTALTSRARKSLEQSLGTLLVARAGGEGCTDLTELLAGWDGEYTQLWRKRIAKHIDGCPECTGERKRRFSPAAILVALPMLALPLGLRLRTMNDAQPGLVAYTQPLPDPVTGGGKPQSDAARNPSTSIDGTPAWDYPLADKSSPRMLWLPVAAVLLLLLIGGTWLVLGTDDTPTPAPVVDVGTSTGAPATPTTVASTQQAESRPNGEPQVDDPGPSSVESSDDSASESVESSAPEVSEPDSSVRIRIPVDPCRLGACDPVTPPSPIIH